MRHLILTTVLGLVATAAVAQSDPVVMTVNGVPVTRSEFEYSYNKNNNEGVIDRKSVAEYADLYANYKMKVQAALDERLDTLSSFKQEFMLYRDQQVRPTLVSDAEVVAEARKAYDRVKENVGTKGLIQPAHIFYGLSSKASPEEQARVKQRADSAYNAIKNGAKFEDLAKKVSEDLLTSERGGLMGWMQPNQAYPEFEEVAYSLQPGELSRPFMDPNGYHIVLMKARKPLETFEEVKDQIVRSFEQRGIRDAIAQYKLRTLLDSPDNTLTMEQVMEKRADSLAAADPEMKYLIQEYHDGLLLYEISNRQVWDRAAKDEVGQRAWFEAHKKDYAWTEPRYKGIAYHVKDKADVKAVKKCVKKLPFDQWADALRTTFNPDSVIRIRVEKGIFKPGDNPTIDQMVFKVANANAKVNPDYPIDAVYGKKLKKYPEDYTDVRAQVISDYQEMLEQEWIASLRRRYPVKIYDDVLKTVNQH